MFEIVFAVASWFIINIVHVAAHLLVARKFGVAADQVSLGFGPAVWSRTSWATTYRIAILPVAVLVRLRRVWRPGPEGIWPPTRDDDLRAKSVGVRLAVFASAPSVILLLGLLASFWMSGYGSTVPSDAPVVGVVEPDEPADEAGLESGDRVVTVDGKGISTWGDIATHISGSQGETITVQLKRGDETITVDIEPTASPYDNRRIIGIRPTRMTEPAPSLFPRIGATVTTVVDWYGMLFKRMFEMLFDTRVGRLAPISPGPRISDEYRQAASITYELLGILFLCMVLPYLDGRRLLFLGVEVAARRPIHPKYEQWFNRIWLALIAIAFVLVIAFFTGFDLM